MNKSVIILFLIISLISCNKKINNNRITEINHSFTEIEDSETVEVIFPMENLDQISKDGLKIWELITNQKFEDLARYISKENGLQISTEGIFDSVLDLNISYDAVAKIADDNDIQDLYFSAVGEYLPFTNKQIFDQFFSFPVNRITEIKTNSIVTRDYIYDEYNISSILDSFPSDSNLVDIFIEPEIIGSMDWYHIFLVINYVEQKPFLYGLAIVYNEF